MEIILHYRNRKEEHLKGEEAEQFLGRWGIEKWHFDKNYSPVTVYSAAGNIEVELVE